MKQILGTALSIAMLAGLGGVAYAQTAKRTWVSTSGVDTNDCTRALPCRTFAVAISKTADFGEVDAVDVGSYAPFVISKSITINGGGGATINVAGNATGIEVNAAFITVALRNLEINGNGSGANGVKFLGGGRQLVIDHVRISGVTQNGIQSLPDGPTAQRNVVIVHSIIAGTGRDGATYGVNMTAGTATIGSSIITSNFVGLSANGTGVINAEGNVLNFNGTAVDVLGSTVRLSNNDVYNNLTGFRCAPDVVLASTGNNRKAENVGGGATACAPNAVVTLQ